MANGANVDYHTVNVELFYDKTKNLLKERSSAYFYYWKFPNHKKENLFQLISKIGK